MKFVSLSDHTAACSQHGGSFSYGSVKFSLKSQQRLIVED